MWLSNKTYNLLGIMYKNIVLITSLSIKTGVSYEKFRLTSILQKQNNVRTQSKYD